MSTASPAQHHLALRLLQRQANGTAEPDSLLAAAEQACEKLCIRLAKLVTADGCQALLARAIHLAGAEFPFLRAVRAGVVPGVCLEGLHESAQGMTAEQTRDGVTAVVAELIGLLALFIGDHVTGRLLREVWPEMPLDEGGALSMPQESQP